jgi:hypothetical protein
MGGNKPPIHIPIKMMKKLFLGLTLIPLFLQSQNIAFKEMPGIIALSDTNYSLAKQKIKTLSRQHKIDPQDKLLFLYSSLQNKDIPYFKKNIKKLIINDGFHYSKYYQQTVDINFSQLVKNQNLESWLLNISEKNHYKWVKNHPIAYEIQKQIIEISILDQTRQYLYRIQNKFQTSDSIAYFILKENDGIAFERLIKLCQSINGIPNSMDYGIYTSNLFSISFWHSLYPDCIENNWQRILPFVENTYFEGKIGTDLFWIYDFQLTNHFGYQYYGTIPDVPVKDSLNLTHRQVKYHLKP